MTQYQWQVNRFPQKKYNLSTSYIYLPDTMHYSNCIIE